MRDTRGIRTILTHTVVKQNIIITSVFLLLLAGCAGQRAPEGGPPDTTPPEIISVYPEPRTINFSDNKVVFEFSEYVDKRSAEEAVFISPSIQDKEFDWSGREVEITFNEPLKKNTTYVITVGTDVKDIRAGNRMAQSVTLSFSTGNKIDEGMVQGKVYDNKPDGVMIFSYRLNDIKVDTLDPVYNKPDYITQTGKDGAFILSNIRAGTYRLFAIRDEYRNLLYDPETDDAGTTNDVTLTEKDTIAGGIKFIIAKEDTTPPRLASVHAPDKRHVVVQFSEPLDSTSVLPSYFSITDTFKTPLLKVLELFPNGVWNSVTLVTDSQKTDELYLLTVDSVLDKSGFVINSTANEKLFKGSLVRDTIPPMLLFSTARDTSSKIMADQSVVFSFSDALQFPIPDSTLTLLSVRDSAKLLYSFKILSPASFAIQPKEKLQYGAIYAVTMQWDAIKDLAGNGYRDSITTMKFSVIDPEQYGSIEGRCVSAATLPIVINSKNVSSKNQPTVSVKAEKSGNFMLQLLPEGNYALSAFIDSNNNMLQDAGKVFPYEPAEKFMLYKDTVRVRARWPVDGVQFDMDMK